MLRHQNDVSQITVKTKKQVLTSAEIVSLRKSGQMGKHLGRQEFNLPLWVTGYTTSQVHIKT